MFETYCKNKGYLLKSWVRNEISIRDEKCKSQEKKKKKRMKYESSLEFVEKEKDVTILLCLKKKLFRMKERPNMNFWPMLLCAL